jgi:hypothetical protein
MDLVPAGPLRRRDISPVVGMARETTSIRGAFVGGSDTWWDQRKMALALGDAEPEGEWRALRFCRAPAGHCYDGGRGGLSRGGATYYATYNSPHLNQIRR